MPDLRSYTVIKNKQAHNYRKADFSLLIKGCALRNEIFINLVKFTIGQMFGLFLLLFYGLLFFFPPKAAFILSWFVFLLSNTSEAEERENHLHALTARRS